MVINEAFVDYNKIVFTPLKAEPGQRHKITYAAEVCSFDIETTKLDDIEQSVMYIWQMSIDNKLVIIGRDWQSYRHMITEIRKRLGPMLSLIVWVHNLSHEFQFLSGQYDFDNKEIFALDSRKILRATEYYGHIEFRCSYKLTNMSLAEASKKYGVTYAKKSGKEFDYSIKRYPQGGGFAATPLTRKELLYCVYDVLSVVEIVKKLMELFNDNLYSIPYTSTGYVRRELKEAMKPYKRKVKDIYPTIQVYRLLRQAFRGGNTHANRYYAGEVIHNVTRKDKSSSYPAQQCMNEYPMEEFKEVLDLSHTNIERLLSLNAALLFRIRMYGVELRNEYIPVPYIPCAKCWPCVGAALDNGRVLRADTLEITVTDIDYKIIMQQYKAKRIEIIAAYKSWYDSLPEGFINTNKKYFRQKTELKGVAGQERYYMASKQLLNAIYGDSVKDPVKPEILYQVFLEDGTIDYYVESTEKTQEQLLEQAKKVAYSVYQWGVWTTAYARQALQRGIDLCGDNLVYCDTDCCCYVGQVDFEPMNAEIQQRAIDRECFAVDPKGNTHYMGVWESDGEFSEFITQGAKRYAYVEDGELHITVSGVSKKQGAKFLQDHGGITAFKPGFVFANCGKTESIYNDVGKGVITYDNRKLYVPKNVMIRDCDYTLSLSEDYAELLNVSAECLKDVHKIWRNSQYTN